jgi:hypothetical protein
MLLKDFLFSEENLPIAISFEDEQELKLFCDWMEREHIHPIEVINTIENFDFERNVICFHLNGKVYVEDTKNPINIRCFNWILTMGFNDFPEKKHFDDKGFFVEKKFNIGDEVMVNGTVYGFPNQSCRINNIDFSAKSVDCCAARGMVGNIILRHGLQIRAIGVELDELLQQNLNMQQVFYYASLIHLVFVKIHPFNDGNGRTGRLLEKWFMSSMLGEKAWYIGSEHYYYKNLQAYYHNLARVGLFYEELSYEKSIPFLLMLPNSLINV